MIDVRVTVGIYDDLKNAEVIRMQLGALPRIGEALLMTPELKRMADKKIKEWNLAPDTRVNYVKCIAYDQQPTPVLMLSTNPKLINMDCIMEDRKTTFGLNVPSIPRIGEQIVTPQEEYRYVENIIYTPWMIYAQLSVQEVLPLTRIADDTPVLVEVANNSPIEVDVRQIDREIDVNVTNTTLYVEGSRGV